MSGERREVGTGVFLTQEPREDGQTLVIVNELVNKEAEIRLDFSGSSNVELSGVSGMEVELTIPPKGQAAVDMLVVDPTQGYSIGYSVSSKQTLVIPEVDAAGDEARGLYVDSQYPPTPDGLEGTGVECRWVRAAYLFPDTRPTLFGTGDSISPSDVCQGRLGDCWFLSTLAVLAEFPDTVRHLFVTGNDTLEKEGKATVRVCSSGCWEEVTVDTYLPCYPPSGTLAFARNSEASGGLWVPLLEKAFAKHHGGYKNIIGGNTANALSIMTGCITFRFDTPPCGQASQEEKEEEGEDVLSTSLAYRGSDEGSVTFSQILQWDRERYLMGASTPSSDFLDFFWKESGGRRSSAPVAPEKLADMTREWEGYGFVMGHAYSITRAVSFSSHKLLQMRNPWGRGEWKGDWSDTSPLWDEVPGAREACGFEGARDDGLYWIKYEDFVRYFPSITVCKQHSDADAEKDWADLRYRAALSSSSCTGVVVWPAEDTRTEVIVWNSETVPGVCVGALVWTPDGCNTTTFTDGRSVFCDLQTARGPVVVLPHATGLREGDKVACGVAVLCSAGIARHTLFDFTPTADVFRETLQGCCMSLGRPCEVSPLSSLHTWMPWPGELAISCVNKAEAEELTLTLAFQDGGNDREQPTVVPPQSQRLCGIIPAGRFSYGVATAPATPTSLQFDLLAVVSALPAPQHVEVVQLNGVSIGLSEQQPPAGELASPSELPEEPASQRSPPSSESPEEPTPQKQGTPPLPPSESPAELTQRQGTPPLVSSEPPEEPTPQKQGTPPLPPSESPAELTQKQGTPPLVSSEPPEEPTPQKQIPPSEEPTPQQQGTSPAGTEEPTPQQQGTPPLPPSESPEGRQGPPPRPEETKQKAAERALLQLEAEAAAMRRETAPDRLAYSSTSSPKANRHLLSRGMQPSGGSARTAPVSVVTSSSRAAIFARLTATPQPKPLPPVNTGGRRDYKLTKEQQNQCVQRLFKDSVEKREKDLLSLEKKLYPVPETRNILSQEDLVLFVDKMYTQERIGREDRRKDLESQYLKLPPRKVLNKERQAAVVKKLYDTVDKDRELSTTLDVKYNRKRSKKVRTQADWSSTVDRLYTKQ